MDFSTPVSVGNTYADLDTDDEIQEVPVNPKLVPSIGKKISLWYKQIITCERLKKQNSQMIPVGKWQKWMT